MHTKANCVSRKEVGVKDSHTLFAGFASDTQCDDISRPVCNGTPDAIAKSGQSRHHSRKGSQASSQDRSQHQTSDKEDSPGQRRLDAPVQRFNAPTNKDGKFICLYSTKCDGYVFDRKCEWNKHMDKHERPYRCTHPDCARLQGFTYSGGLLRHEREVHGKHSGSNSQLVCTYPGCKREGKAFTRTENLKEHCRRVHREQSQSSMKQNSSKTSITADADDVDVLQRSETATALLERPSEKQIRRENGYLQKPMEELDSIASKLEDRIKAVENAVIANAVGDTDIVAALTKLVEETDPEAIDERISGMERNVKKRPDDINAAMTKIIEGFERDKQLAEEERKATLAKDTALLKRIGEVQEVSDKYQKNLDLVEKRDKGSRFDQIKNQLNGLTKQVMGGGRADGKLVESIATLEKANAELVEVNEKLEAQLKKSEPRPSRQGFRGGAAAATATPHDGTTASSDDSSSQWTKSHKWACSADNDIICQGAESFGIKSTPTPPAPKPKANGSKKPTGEVPKKKITPKKKNPIVSKPSSDSSERKSHKWAGGGADGDTIVVGLSPRPKYGHQDPGTDCAIARKPQSKAREVVNGKEVVRSGRGWFEVEISPEPEIESRVQRYVPKYIVVLQC